MSSAFDSEIRQILTISRHLFECVQTDAAYYLLKAASQILFSQQDTEAILQEARYQVSQRSGVQWEGAIEVTVRDYIQLMQTVKQDGDFSARLGAYLDEHGSLDGFWEQEGL